jgi:transcriptional regulator with XRE-family HTH domain
MLVAGPQLRAARAMARLEQARLAELSGVAAMTIVRLEAENGLLNARGKTLRALQRALEAAGVEFINGDRPGVRMREPVAA